MTTTVTIAVNEFTASGPVALLGHSITFKPVPIHIDSTTDTVLSEDIWEVAIVDGVSTTLIPDSVSGYGVRIGANIQGWKFVTVASYPVGTISLADLVNNYAVNPITLEPTPAPDSWWTALNNLVDNSVAQANQYTDEQIADVTSGIDSDIATAKDEAVAAAAAHSDAADATNLAAAETYTDNQLSPFGKINVPILPTMSQAAIQALVNANPAGTRFSFAPGTYAHAGPITLPNDNVIIDAPQATFTQTTWARPAFDAIGRNGCVFDIGLVQFIGTRGGVSTSYRGSSGYVSGAAIWINGDNNTVRRLKTLNMAVGIFLSSWNGTSANDRVGVGNRLGEIETSGANFSLLYVAQNDLVIDDIYGHDDIDDSAGANPTHVIYGSAITSFRASRGVFRSVRGKNVLNGQPFQAKFHDGLRVGSLLVEDSKGLLNLIDCNDFRIDSYRGLRLLANGGQGMITLQRSVTNSQRPDFGPGFVQQAANVDERVVNIISDFGVFNSLEVESNHSASVTPASAGAEILVRGTGNSFRNPKVRALGSVPIPGFYVGFGELASGTLITNPELSGVLSGVKVSSSSLGVTVNYDSTFQSTSAAFFDTNNGVESVASSTIPGGALSTFGDHGILALLAATGTPTVGAANSALQVRVTPKRNITVTSLTWWSAVASGNYDIAIIDDLTNVVLWSKGSTAWPAAGKTTETVPSIKMIAGRSYRLVFAADNATGTLRGNQASISGLDQRLDGSTAATTTTSSFPIPTTTLAPGSNGTTTRTPLIIVGGS